MYLDKKAFVARLTEETGNSGKERYTTFSGFQDHAGNPTAAIDINIQPANPQLVALAQGVIGKVFTAFTTASGVAEGMRLTVSGTEDRFIVQGREAYEFVQDHYELTLSKGKER